MSTFEAKYPGQCEACGDRFDAGDEIAYAPGFDRPVCRGCLADPERATRRELAKAPCTECWLVHEGECL